MSARRWIGAALLGVFIGGCATEGSVGVGVAYDAWYYDPWYDWYGYGGCCVDYPDGIGPPAPGEGGPRPSHPIAGVPGDGAKPSNPIASTPQPKASQSSTRTMSSPRPAAMPRGGGMRGGGGRR
jgi:hypothetical protein